MHYRIQHILHMFCARVAGYSRAFHAWFSALPQTTRMTLYGAGVLFVAVCMAFYLNVYRAPADFPEHTIVGVAQGSSLREIATQFEEQHIVRSAAWLEMFVALFAGDRGVQAGEYYFPEEKSVFGVAQALATGEYGIAPIRVTIPEGSTTADIARILERQIPDFDSTAFLEHAQVYEGFLFPDTYDFLPTATPETITARMRENFTRRIASLADEIDSGTYSEREIVTMASIVGKEGITYADKKRIAGILWSRIEIGMPLQVDAVFPYINGKNTFELTYADLDIDSPYNTYRYRGLPPGPIANPGLESIEAVLQPEDTEYLYYLSDYDGNLYYSETFDEHVRKKNIYLP